MNNVKQALLELVNLQKQRIVQLESQVRHMARDLCHTQDPTYYSAFASEIGDVIRIRGEDWKLLSKNRNECTITLKLIESKQ